MTESVGGSGCGGSGRCGACHRGRRPTAMPLGPDSRSLVPCIVPHEGPEPSGIAAYDPGATHTDLPRSGRGFGSTQSRGLGGGMASDFVRVDDARLAAPGPVAKGGPVGVSVSVGVGPVTRVASLPPRHLVPTALVGSLHLEYWGPEPSAVAGCDPCATHTDLPRSAHASLSTQSRGLRGGVESVVKGGGWAGFGAGDGPGCTSGGAER